MLQVLEYLRDRVPVFFLQGVQGIQTIGNFLEFVGTKRIAFQFFGEFKRDLVHGFLGGLGFRDPLFQIGVKPGGIHQAGKGDPEETGGSAITFLVQVLLGFGQLFGEAPSSQMQNPTGVTTSNIPPQQPQPSTGG